MVDANSARAWLEHTKSEGMALGLLNTQRALSELGLPPRDYETVHVAGSNGKGTVLATLSAAFSATGITNLTFTSPHLVRVEERIRLNGYPVSSERFDRALVKVHEMVERSGLTLTFFETTFLIAMVVAAEEPIEVLMLETGLGGRLDATRVAPADVALVTALSLEHTEVLGDTLEDIAGEKAAIARPGRPVLVRNVKQAAARQRITQCAAEAGSMDVDGAVEPAPLTWVDVTKGATYFEEAGALARAVWPHLKCAENISFPKIRGLRWPGRMQDVPSPAQLGMNYLLEGAHNPSGMMASCAQLRTLDRWNEPWALLLGCTPQRDMKSMLKPLVALCKAHPPVALVLTEPQFGRYPGVPCEEIAAVLREDGLEITRAFSLPEKAIAWLETEAHGAKTVLSIGSLYLQGNVLAALGADDDEGLAIVAKD